MFNKIVSDQYALEVQKTIYVVPDADKDSTAKGLLASSMGSAELRCMAASVAVGVSKIDHITVNLLRRQLALNLV